MARTNLSDDGLEIEYSTVQQCHMLLTFMSYLNDISTIIAAQKYHKPSAASHYSTSVSVSRVMRAQNPRQNKI